MTVFCCPFLPYCGLPGAFCWAGYSPFIDFLRKTEEYIQERRRYVWTRQNCSCTVYLKELGEICIVKWALCTWGFSPESLFADWLAFQVSSGLRLHWFNSLRRNDVHILKEFVPYRGLEVTGAFRKTCFHWQVNWRGLKKKKVTSSFS